MNDITIGSKKEIAIIQGKEYLLYRGKAANSIIFSEHQNYLLKSGQGKKLKELDDNEWRYLYNELVAMTDAKFESREASQENFTLFQMMLLKNKPETYRSEISIAYEMADKKLLTDIKGELIQLYREVSYRSVSDIVEAFQRYFKKQFESLIRSQKFNVEEEIKEKISDEQLYDSMVMSINNIIDNFKNTGKVTVWPSYINAYDQLKRIGVINKMTKDEKGYYLSTALANVKKENILRSRDFSNSLDTRNNAKKLAESVMDTDAIVLSEAKRLYIETLAKQWVEFDYEIEDILNSK